MKHSSLSIRRLCMASVLLTVLLITGGCSGITPGGQLRNNREEGPESGLFSGPAGEFILVAPGDGSGKKTTPKAWGTTPETAQ